MIFLGVLAIFKNEAMMIDLWVRHYLWMGVDHLYLIDNGSTDNSMDVLKPYIDKKLATVFSLPEKYKQIEHYRYVYDRIVRKRCKWVIVADLDEFWYVNNSTIKKELRNFNQYNVIYSNWRMFGSDGNIQHPQDIRVSNIHRVKDLHVLTKCIFQTRKVKSEQIHVHGIHNDTKIINASQVFRLNHYPVPSWDYFKKVKMTRGDVHWQHHENTRDETYFNNYNKNTDHEDSDLKRMVLSSN